MKWGPVIEFLGKRGIKPQYSLPYAHYQNLVERYVQTIVKAVSVTIHGQSFLKANLWDYALFYAVDRRNLMPNSKTGRNTLLQLVTGNNHVDLERENLFSFGELVIVQNNDKNWKFDLKNDVAVYLGHPKGTVNGGAVYFPYVKKIAERTDITPANIPEEAYKQFFARRYEVKEQSTSQTLSQLFENLEMESDDEIAVCFTIKLMDQDEVSNDLSKDTNTQANNSIPESAEEMMAYLPEELCNNFEQLWKHQNMKSLKCNNVPKAVPPPTDRVTHSMTQRVKALTAKGIRMKVREALNSEHSSEWIEAIKLEINSLINDFECLVPEEINPDRDHDCIHATVDLKIKYIDEIMIDKFKARICGFGNELVRRTTYTNETYSPTVSHLTHSTMLQLAIYDSMHICTIDTVGAFLYQDYPESLKPLYILLLVAVTEACNLDPKTTYRVKKYI
jgi:hypothetical protein